MLEQTSTRQPNQFLLISHPEQYSSNHLKANSFCILFFGMWKQDVFCDTRCHGWSDPNPIKVFFAKLRPLQFPEVRCLYPVVVALLIRFTAAYPLSCIASPWLKTAQLQGRLTWGKLWHCPQEGGDVLFSHPNQCFGIILVYVSNGVTWSLQRNLNKSKPAMKMISEPILSTYACLCLLLKITSLKIRMSLTMSIKRDGSGE